MRQDITVDSGAAQCVADCDEFPDIQLEPSPMSMAGQNFIGPGGEKIKNRGQKTVDWVTEECLLCSTTWQDATVRKPLAWVSAMCKKGNLVIFDEEESVIMSRDSSEGQQIRALIKQAKQKIRMYQSKEVYTIPAWILPKNDRSQSKPSFQRQGN